MEVSQEQLNAAASAENDLMQRATLDHLNKRVVELRILNSALIGLLEGKGIDWEAELEPAKRVAVKKPQDRRKTGATPKKRPTTPRST